MSRKRDRSPSSSPPQLSMPWMNLDTNIVHSLSNKPARSLLLQQAASSDQSLLTPGQNSRLQIADTVRLVMTRFARKQCIAGLMIPHDKTFCFIFPSNKYFFMKLLSGIDKY